MVYFIWFYKPLELLPSISDFYVIADINEMEKSFHRMSLVFFFLISFLGIIFIVILGSLIYEEIVLFTKPIIAVNARLKSKESVSKLAGSRMGFLYVGYIYSLTFEVDNGDEIDFVVIPKYYMTIIEGNKGNLKYKQGRLNRFICFDLTSID